MDWKLFASTFALIFLAELGDKTQLAAFAATAGSKSPVSIFLGASAALVMSTLIAVMVGSALQKVVPVHCLKVGAGVLFVIFGVLLLWSVRPGRAEASLAPTEHAAAGLATRLVLSTALEFEKASAADYRSMAAVTMDNGLKTLLLSLADEEDGHLRQLHTTLETHVDTRWSPTDLPQVESMEPPVSRLDEASARILNQAIKHEEATAGFYRELAAAAPLPGLRRAFAELAGEEQAHARRLTEFGWPRPPASSGS